MASGTVTIKIRPLRVGFIVDPSDRAGLYQAITLSSLLWGGSYNPIIPAYRRTPRKWEPSPVRHLPLPADIIEGYINGFDPDLIVPIGICSNRSYQIGNRTLVQSNDLIGNFNESISPYFGISIFELLNDFIDKELKYKRYDNLQICFPILPRRYALFLASVFGALPDYAQKLVEDNFMNIPCISIVNLSLSRFTEQMK